MNRQKNAAALDCHPQQQLEIQPLSKRHDLKEIIDLMPKFMQLPINPRLVVDILLLMPGTQIYSGFIKNKYILSSQPDLSMDSELNVIPKEYKSGKHFEKHIRRLISPRMKGNYFKQVVFQVNKEMNLLGIKGNLAILKQDNCRISQEILARQVNHRLAEAFAAVIWERIITRCENNYESMETDSIIVSI